MICRWAVTSPIVRGCGRRTDEDETRLAQTQSGDHGGSESGKSATVEALVSTLVSAGRGDLSLHGTEHTKRNGTAKAHLSLSLAHVVLDLITLHVIDNRRHVLFNIWAYEDP